MLTCGFCLKNYDNKKSFVVHLKLIHKCCNTTKFNCAQAGCYRNFPNLNSYLKHLKNHKVNNCLEKPKEVTNNINKKRHETSSENELPESPDDLTHNEKSKDCEFLDMETLKSICNKNLVEFFSKLYGQCSLTRKDVQNLLNYLTDFLTEPLNLLKEQIISLLTHYKLLDSDKGKVVKLFNIFNDISSLYGSEYLRFDFLKKSGKFIEPSSLKISEQLEATQNISLKHITVQYVPPGQVLKNFFELPMVFERTMVHMKYLQNTKTSGLVSNIIQTQFWQDKLTANNLPEDTIPILLYFDDFEVGNPLGSHAGIHKLGAIYYSIATFPKFQAQLEHIFLGLLFHSSDLKKFGAKAMFSKLIDDLNYIEYNGISVIIHDVEYKLYFSVALILGDNLGIHTMAGFTESFSNNFCCRFCKCSKVVMQSLCKQDESTLRNRENYSEDLQISDVSSTGIKSYCVWNNLRSFHIIENYVVDIMHDIFEGVAVVIIMRLLHQFILKDEFFTLETLNFRLKHFKFGPEVSNRPPLISEDNLKRKKINMSASEMKCMLLYSGFLFGRFIPVHNEHWKMYISLIQILYIVLSKTVSKTNCEKLNNYVERLNSHYIKLFAETLTPKMHHLLHYGYILSKTGPPNNLSSFRYEAKHRQSKLSSNVVASRKNITKTLAIKHQLVQSREFSCQKGFIDTVVVNTYSVLSENTIEYFELQELFLVSDISFDFTKGINVCNKVTVHNTSYKSGGIILIDQNVKIFGKINTIVVSYGKSNIYFVISHVNSRFDQHVMAYELSDSTEKKVVCHSELYYHKTFTPVAHNGKKYIVCEY